VINMVLQSRARGGYRAVRLSLTMDDCSGKQLRAAIRLVAREVFFPKDSLEAMLTGATEACTNAFKYGSLSDDGTVEVCVHANATEVTARLYYPSEAFVFANNDQCLPGGSLGHRLMSLTLDEIHYRFRNGWALGRLVKRA
jgi:two-component sensor histidine kinase